jgi:uncharacterized protein
MDRQVIRGGIAADKEYWDYLDQGQFRLPRCAGCQQWMWPANFRCGECGCWDMEWIERPMSGVVYSWTRTWYSFDHVEERAEDLPYSIALVEVVGSGGARVLGVVKGDDSGLRVGGRVSGDIDPPSIKTKGYSAVVWEVEP